MDGRAVKKNRGITALVLVAGHNALDVDDHQLAASRVGKVSGFAVSGRVSGMPEMPGTKPRFWAPETARNCTKLPETARNYKS